jgi:hypothetical protein
LSKKLTYHLPGKFMRTYFLLLLSLVILSSCSITRNIPDDRYLLRRNRILVDDSHVKSDELRTFVRQNPNRKILGFYRFHLNIYQLADRGTENNLKYWMKNTIGEPPVIYEPYLADATARQFELYLHSKGYFNARVNYQTHMQRRRATVTYQIQGNKPYTIRNKDYNIQDNHLKGFVMQDTINSLIGSGDRYDADILHEERLRISRQLKNKGFYQFSREFIFFRIDSALSSHQLDLEVVINNPEDVRLTRIDDRLHERHRRFIIEQINIYPDYSPFRQSTSFTDTTTFFVEKGTQQSAYNFFHEGPMRIRPRAIVNNIMLEQNNYYSINDVELTYSHLSRLRNFRFINLQFVENTQPNNGRPSDTLGFINAQIELARSPANAFTVEAEGLNTSGNLGIAGNVIYHNRNVFRGAEVLNLRFKGALEVSGESRSEEFIQSLPFNTLEVGAEASIDFPKLLFPIRMERLSKTARPKSTLLTGINFRQRPDYTRYIYNLSYGFEWSPDSRKRQHLYPLEISSIKVFNDSLLQAKIPDNNPLLLSRFKDHLITGTKYSYSFSSQELGRDVDFMYFRGNMEVAGNLLYLISETLDAPRDNNQSYRLFNIPFAQYVKGDADFRYYRVYDQNNTLAFRLMAGVGIPYGNLNVLPFVKSYYGGGANSIRAWRIYSLGPGRYQDSLDVRFDSYGDIKLEANAEYRFNIYKFWKGAFFVDAGNVWFLKENPQFPGGDFNTRHFYKDIAIGTGAGLRLDFDFFIVRIDAAFRVRDPARPSGNRWISKTPGWRNWNFNLGIGYPF